MVTRIGRHRQLHLYIAEHREAKGLSVESVANRIGTDRTTVWRWENEQHRLNPEKIAALAEALDIEPTDLYRPPGRTSLDAILKDAPDTLNETAADIVRSLIRRAN